jgi:hypothetical protein
MTDGTTPTLTSRQPGTSTLGVEVVNVSRQGFWLRLGPRELFVPFSLFPWFLDAPIGKLMDVRMLHAGHLNWPGLDVDLTVESIEDPDRYPLVTRATSRVAEPKPRDE